MPSHPSPHPPTASVGSTPVITSHFWADWDPKPYPDPTTGKTFRLRRDTRIYWKPQSSGTVGNCVGTFFGENPGSAQSVHGPTSTGYSPLQDGYKKPGDLTLRLILEIWQEAFRLGRVNPASADYVEVLNTYYFSDPISTTALSAWRAIGGAGIYSPVPRSSSRFVLLGWGKDFNEDRTNLCEIRNNVSLLRCCPRIVIPDTDAQCVLTTGTSLSSPVGPSPASPSGIVRRGRKRPYVTEVSKLL